MNIVYYQKIKIFLLSRIDWCVEAGRRVRGRGANLSRSVDFLTVTIRRFVSLWISGFLGHLRSLRRPCYPLGQPHVPYTGFLCKQKAAEIYRVDLNMTRLQIRFDPPSIQAWWSSAIIPYTPHTMHGLGGLENTELPTLPSNFSKAIPRESSFICRPFRGRQFLRRTV